MIRAVHYTGAEHFSLKPIEIQKENHLPCKPRGGMWFAEKKSDDWRKWCEVEGFRVESLGKEVICNLDDTNFIVVKSRADEEKLRKYIKQAYPGIPGKIGLDFTKMKEDGIDGLQVTESGFQNMSHDLDDCFYGWDLPSIVVLNERAIRSCEIIQREC